MAALKAPSRISANAFETAVEYGLELLMRARESGNTDAIDHALDVLAEAVTDRELALLRNVCGLGDVRA